MKKIERKPKVVRKTVTTETVKDHPAVPDRPTVVEKTVVEQSPQTNERLINNKGIENKESSSHLVKIQELPLLPNPPAPIGNGEKKKVGFMRRMFSN